MIRYFFHIRVLRSMGEHKRILWPWDGEGPEPQHPPLPSGDVYKCLSWWQWGRRPQRPPGAPGRGGCRDKRISRKTTGRREGGGRGWRGRRGSRTRMLMRVRRRKEEERENIDLRQEKREASVIEEGGPYPAWTSITSEEGDRSPR